MTDHQQTMIVRYVTHEGMICTLIILSFVFVHIPRYIPSTNEHLMCCHNLSW